MDELLVAAKGNEPFLIECRVKTIVYGKLFECLVKEPPCNKSIPFGSRFFCTHQLNKQIAAISTGDN